MHFLILVHFFVNGVSGSLMGSDRQGNRDVTPSVAKLCQRDGLNGFRPLLNLFSNVLTFPQPPPHPFFSQCLEVAETYISLSVFLIVVFLYGCSPLFFLLLSTQLIRASAKQIKAQGHAHELKHSTSDSHFQRIYNQTWSCRLILCHVLHICFSWNFSWHFTF